ncbi:hypothetical protein [Paraburkholderia xenovorans]
MSQLSRIVGSFSFGNRLRSALQFCKLLGRPSEAVTEISTKATFIVRFDGHRENGINANMLLTWRRRYLAEQQARKVDGMVDADLLRIVLGSLRS